MQVTINNLQCQKERISLPAPAWEGREEWGTGVTLEAIYRGPRTGRMVIKLLSRWQGEGESYDEVCAEDYLGACQLAGIEPAGIEVTDL